MTASDFSSLGLSEPILRALTARNYTTPTPIQAQAIPHLMQGRDLLGIAQTGTGKTAAFALPMLHYLSENKQRPLPRQPRTLILAPTRELATQIADSFEAYGRGLGLRGTTVFGGVGQSQQVKTLLRGVDVLVATPGRLLDLIQQRHCDLSQVEILVLDEADRMLDMGFLPDVKRILSTIPRDRQSLLFSATMPADITALAGKLLHDPVRVEVTPQAATADRIEQSIYFVKKADKRDLLSDLLSDPQFQRTLVFTRTKHGADRVVKHLQHCGIKAHAIHGNKSQNARERALDDFRSGKAPVLIATDIAARGIDVPEITHVINFDLPNISESYVHRIGRTARAGREGIAISFCDGEEREFLRDIEKLIKQRIPVVSRRDAMQQSSEPREEGQRDDRQTVRPAGKPAAKSQNPWQDRNSNQPNHPRSDDRDATEPQPAAPRRERRPEREMVAAGADADQRPSFGSFRRYVGQRPAEGTDRGPERRPQPQGGGQQKRSGQSGGRGRSGYSPSGHYHGGTGGGGAGGGSSAPRRGGATGGPRGRRKPQR